VRSRGAEYPGRRAIHLGWCIGLWDRTLHLAIFPVRRDERALRGSTPLLDRGSWTTMIPLELRVEIEAGAEPMLIYLFHL
jgi:hypothetical protein